MKYITVEVHPKFKQFLVGLPIKGFNSGYMANPEDKNGLDIFYIENEEYRFLIYNTKVD